ncbi:MAG: hypothetical protein ACI8SE_001789 [Bacteroidia bacterium]|jgi:hypothetical protein
MINALELVSISDFILAGLCLFLSGILFGKVESHLPLPRTLCYFILFAGLSAFMGGIDHGFFEPINQRFVTKSLTYICIAAATFTLFRYTVLTYFQGNGSRILLVIAYVQLVAFVIGAFFFQSFLLVVANYAPVLILFFIMNLLHVKRSKSELYFTMFCAIMIVATLVQVFHIEISPMINGDTLFHIIAIIAYLYMYKGVNELTKSDD